MANLLVKYVDEQIYVTLDFASVLSNLIISSITSIEAQLMDGTTSTDVVISDSSILTGSQSIQFKVTGGLYNYTYRLVGVVVTNDGQIIQGEGELTVER